MPRIAAAELQAVRAVAARYGIAPDEVHGIARGRANRHWRIRAGPYQYALRRYARRRSPAAIAYEHEVLAYVARAGWPVAPPLVPQSGATCIEHDGQRFSLFRFLPGRPAPVNNTRYSRAKGALLARLHGDMAGYNRGEQRNGFTRLNDLDTISREGGFASFEAMLNAFGQEFGEAARIIAAQRDENVRELSDRGYAGLPDTLVHADFGHDNLLFQRGRLTGLLDFDSVRRDARVADIADSLALDCLRAPAYDAVELETASAFVEGYACVSALSPGEAALIVPLVRAWILSYVAFRLTEWATRREARALASIRRSVERRFPSLDARRPMLEAAVRNAAASTGVC